MKLLSAIIVIAVLTYFTGIFLPWWCGGIFACGVVFLLRLSPWKACLAGLLGLILAWGVPALIISMQNAHLLSNQIGTLFMGLPPAMIIVLTAVVGGLSGALGGLTGGLLYASTSGRDRKS